MRPLARLERHLEQWLAAPAALLMRGKLHPVELAALVGRTLEEKAIVGLSRSYAPDELSIQLHPEDFAHFEALQDALAQELAHYVVETARERGLGLHRRPRVQFIADSSVPVGAPRITAGFQRASDTEAPAPTVASSVQRLQGPDGTTIEIDRLPFRLGRALDNDAVLEDHRVSRHHVMLRLAHGHLCVEDLGSTNGTTVNGETVTLARLEPGDVLSLGGLELVVQGGGP